MLLLLLSRGYNDFGEDVGPQISADLDDIASDDEEIVHIDIRRDETGFGFSIRGGAEYNSPLYVLRIAEGGAAERDNRLQVMKSLVSPPVQWVTGCAVLS